MMVAYLLYMQIDFESLVDLRLVEESQLKTAPKMHKSGKGKSKSKTSGSRDDAESSLSLLGIVSYVCQCSIVCSFFFKIMFALQLMYKSLVTLLSVVDLILSRQ